MTRIESTSKPRSHTARQKRSTMTIVFPVPAPAETKTTPCSSIARSCSLFGASTALTDAPAGIAGVAGQRRRRPRRQSRPGLRRTSQATCSGPPHAAHGPEIAPLRARAALRVVAHVALADAADGRLRVLLGALDLAPEGVLVEVVVALVAGQRVLPRPGPEQPARGAFAGERAVDAAQRLDADQVAQDEHVERDLQIQLALDLGRGVRAAARLVVDDHPARAEGVAVDAVDLPGDGEPSEVEPPLQLGRRALGAERDLELARHERRRRLGLAADELLEVAREALLELAPLEVGHVDADVCLERVAQALAQEDERVLEVLGPRAV